MLSVTRGALSYTELRDAMLPSFVRKRSKEYETWWEESCHKWAVYSLIDGLLCYIRDDQIEWLLANSDRPIKITH